MGDNACEEPDLDVSSIVTEYKTKDEVSSEDLVDPFTHYFDSSEKDNEDMHQLLEEGQRNEDELRRSIASFFGEEHDALDTSFLSQKADSSPSRISKSRSSLVSVFSHSPLHKSPPSGPSSPFVYFDENVESTRGNHQIQESELEKINISMNESMVAELKDAETEGIPYPPIEGIPYAPTTLVPPRPPPPMHGDHANAMNLMMMIMKDKEHAQSIKCLRSKIPKEIPEEFVADFLLHCLQYPNRRPMLTLLQSRGSDRLVHTAVKACLHPQQEQYNDDLPRDNHLRITFKDSVIGLGHLYSIIDSIHSEDQDQIDVMYSQVRGRIAFLGFNNNLPIRVIQPFPSFIELEKTAQQLRAHYQTEIYLSRRDDPRREVYIVYYDTVEKIPQSSMTRRVTEVNVSHTIRPSKRTVSYPPNQPSKVHYFEVTTKMYPTPLPEPVYSLGEVLLMADKYPQY